MLQSRWAYWFGLPISLPAMVVYALLVAATRRRIAQIRASRQDDGYSWIVPLGLVVIAAAVWFGGLQVVVLRAFCVFCLAAHLTATSGAVIILADFFGQCPAAGRPPNFNRRAILVSVLGMAGLLAGQLVVTKKMNTLTTLAAPVLAPSVRPDARVVTLYNGRFQLDVAATPRIGPASARHVVVALFDYTCTHCRDLHELLIQVQARFGDQLVIVTLPVPLDARCNPLVRQTAAENLNACEYARLGLAIWRTKPEAFVPFSAWLFAPSRPPSIEKTREFAEGLVGAGALRVAMGEDWIQRQIQTDIELFEANSKRAGAWQMPQLMMDKALSVGAVQTLDALLVMLEEHLGLKRTE